MPTRRRRDAHAASLGTSAQHAGGALADLPGIAPQIDREAVLRARPDVVVTSTRPVPEGAHFIPGDLMQRHTPRLLEGAERLCEVLERARTAR